MSLNEKNNPIILNSGSITNPDNRHSLQFYSKQVREDLLKIERYINDVSVQVFRTLTDSQEYIDDAIANGLSGKTIKTTLEEETSEDLETVYWDPNRERPKTIYESIAFLTAKLNDISTVVGNTIENPDFTNITNSIRDIRDALNIINLTLNQDANQGDYTISVTVNNATYTSIHEALGALSTRLEALVTANGATELGLLNDVTLTEPINENDVLYYSNNEWVNGKIASTTLNDQVNLVRGGDDVSRLVNDANYVTAASLTSTLGIRGATTVNNIGQDNGRNIALSGSNIESTYNETNYTSADGNDHIDAHLEGIDTKLGELSSSASVLLMENIVAGDRLEGNGPKVLNLVQLNENFSTKKVFLDISADVSLDASNPPDVNGFHDLTIHLGEVIPNTCVELYPYNSVASLGNGDPELNIKYLVKPIEAPTNESLVYFSYTSQSNTAVKDAFEGNKATNGVSFRGRISKITFNVVDNNLIFVTVHAMDGQNLYI